jgi:hypothetical protein
MSKSNLCRCPACGHIDTDEQGDEGHWEQGTSQNHADDPAWSPWFLRCSTQDREASK